MHSDLPVSVGFFLAHFDQFYQAPRSELAFHWKSFALQHACGLAFYQLGEVKLLKKMQKAYEQVIFLASEKKTDCQHL